MASIKGISLKGVKHFETSDGLGVNANIYMDNKKVGSICDSGRGGMMDISFNTRELRIEAEKRSTEYYVDNPSAYDSFDIFFEEILELIEIESFYKKELKKGRNFVLVLLYTKRTELLDEYIPNKVLAYTNEKQLPVILDREKPKEYKIYRSIQDFNI